jgi:CSLREA domain-containing protein
MAAKQACRRLQVCRVSGASAAAIVIAAALMVSATAYGATITVNSLSDADLPHICTLRDAINAANTKTKTNECVAGTGSDTINFDVTGTIFLASTLPEVTDTLLTISGPATPGIRISGRGAVQVMTVAPGVTVNLNGLTIANGTARMGGGINSNGALTVTNCTFSSNTASDWGGAISNDSGTLTVINSTFSGNSSPTANGGGIYSTGTLTVINSTLSNNSATFGCGIYGYETNLTVMNSTFSGNSGGNGGGISAAGPGKLSVTNSTFSGNSAGSEIFNDPRDHVVSARIRNTILAANVGSNCSRFVIDLGYNISDDTTCDFSAAGSYNSTNPMLDPAGLSHNGGPTKTIALLAGSPAINAIPLADCTDQPYAPNPIITDQRGFPRPEAAEANCDIGAYEVQDTPPMPFSDFAGTMTIASDTGTLDMASRFKLGPGATIDPTTQLVGLSVGNYAVRLPVGSFVQNDAGYLYHGTINGIFLRVFIKFTESPRVYSLILGSSVGSSLTGNIQTPVTLTIGDNFGSALMLATVE